MKKINLLMLTILLIAISTFSYADAPEVEWNRTFGGEEDDYGHSVQQTSDGGYIIAGTTESFGNGTWAKPDIYVIKTDSSGNLEWNKTFGGEGEERGGYVLQTSDEGYVIAGYRGGDVYLIKIDSLGNKQWEKTFGSSGSNSIYSIQQTSDGGYVFVGMTYEAGDGDVYLVKTDSSGNMEWNKTFGGDNYDYGLSAQQTSDGGYIIIGWTEYSNKGVYLIKTDSNGDKEWERRFGGRYSEGHSVQQTADSGYIITGSTGSLGHTDNAIYLIKTDSLGYLEWEKVFGGTSDTTQCSYGHHSSVQLTSDNGFIILGYHYVPHDCWNRDFYLIKTDFSGNVEWEKIFGSENDDYPRAVQQTSDGGYVVAGGMATSGLGDPLVYLAKFSPEIFDSCVDGTPYGFCSSQVPFYCDNGILKNNCQLCGCSSGYICQPDGICQEGTCSLDSNCGTNQWSGEIFCCLDDICQRFRNYTCQSGNCSFTEKIELKEVCPWGSNYCREDENVYHSKGCSIGECVYDSPMNAKLVEICQYGCENGSCKTEPDDGLTFYEGFENESSILSNNGTIIGNIEFVETSCGKAVDMSSGSYISYPLEGNFPPLNRLTIEFWFKPSKLSSQGFFDIARLYGTHPNSMGIFYSTMYNVNRVITEIRNYVTGMYQAHAPGSLIGYKWNHVATTFSDYKDNCFKMTTYFNGNPGGKVTVCDFYPNMSRDMWIGNNYYYGYSNAYIDEFKIFNYAKSNDEIYNDYLYMRNCTKEELPRKNCTMYKSESLGKVKINCSGLYVDNKLFTVKGVGYQPIPIGMTADVEGGADIIFNTPKIYNRDFKLLRKMNANIIRTWAKVTNRSFLDAAWNNGTNPIYVVMGFWINCDDNYGDSAVRQKYISNFTSYVNEFKDHPAVLIWAIGNEVNLCGSQNYIDEFYALANDMAKAAYEAEGSNYHPVGIVNWDINHIGLDIYNSDDESLNYLDFWGSNVYPGKTFGTWFDDYAGLSGKPLLITEYGIDALNNSNYKEYEDVHAEWVLRQWKEINNSNITIGSTLMAYSDEWWKAGYPSSHDYGGYYTPNHPDGFSNEEWWGVMRTVKTPPSEIDKMEPREVYYALKKVWRGTDKINISLNTGWNLISIPLELENNSFNYLFNKTNITIYSYKNNSWFVPTAVDNKLGYWVKLNKSMNLTLIGFEIEDKTINLDKGWNLIGYSSLNPLNISESDLKNYTIYTYMNNLWSSYIPNRPFDSLQKLKPGYGYWVKVS